MKLNVRKTKTMAISASPVKLEIHVAGQLLEQVSEFRYLGQIINQDGRSTREINTRIAIAKTTFRKHQRVLTSTNISMKLRKRILMACLVGGSLRSRIVDNQQKGKKENRGTGNVVLQTYAKG